MISLPLPRLKFHELLIQNRAGWMKGASIYWIEISLSVDDREVRKITYVLVSWLIVFKQTTIFYIGGKSPIKEDNIVAKTLILNVAHKGFRASQRRHANDSPVKLLKNER